MSASNRAKRVLSNRGIAIALVVALVGVAALGGAYWVYSTPTTETVTEERNPQTFETTVDTSARVTGNTTIYEQGRVLRNMPVYLTRASPVLRLTVVSTVPADRLTQVTQDLTLVFEATRDGDTFYTQERTIVNRTTQVRNQTRRSAGTVNVSRLGGEVNRVRNEIGPVGTFQVRFELTVNYRTGQYEGVLSSSTPVQLTDGAYWLGNPLEASRTHTQTVTREVTQPPDPAAYGSLAGLGVILLVGAGAIGYVSRRIEVEDLHAEVEHRRYEEWISEGEFPTGTDKRYISINGLEDLVDIAIDSNKRVIHDSSLGIYAVTDGDLVYYFSTDPFNIDAWLDT